MNNPVTTILNVYKRPENLYLQLRAIQDQSIPSDIWIWQNYNKEKPYKLANLPQDVVLVNSENYNFQYHGRFTLALLAKTPFVCVLDDDTIPGHHWLENCINHYQSCPGLYGASGVRLLDSYRRIEKVGWSKGGNEYAERVDLVGHAWFAAKSIYKFLFLEEPISWDNGEDIQFSYLLQKYANLNTYVPTQPKHDLRLWGSDPATGKSLGSDQHASWRQENHWLERVQICDQYLKRGWKTCSQTHSVG